jgi:hypothetical protein
MNRSIVVGTRTRGLARLLYWAPRVLSLLFAGFISLFALDVFGAGYGFWGTLLALAMHLIPTAFILVVAALAWRWEWIGALAFLGMAVWYLRMTWGQEQWGADLLIAGPLFVLAILYFVSWRWRAAHPARQLTSA